MGALTCYCFLFVFVHRLAAGEAGNYSAQTLYFMQDNTHLKLCHHPSCTNMRLIERPISFLLVLKGMDKICTDPQCCCKLGVHKPCDCPGKYTGGPFVPESTAEFGGSFLWQRKVSKLEEPLQRCFICCAYLQIPWRRQQEQPVNHQGVYVQ